MIPPRTVEEREEERRALSPADLRVIRRLRARRLIKSGPLGTDVFAALEEERCKKQQKVKAKRKTRQAKKHRRRGW